MRISDSFTKNNSQKSQQDSPETVQVQFWEQIPGKIKPLGAILGETSREIQIKFSEKSPGKINIDKFEKAL